MRACLHISPRFRRAGCTTAAGPSCSTRSPGCRLIIRRGPRPRCSCDHARGRRAHPPGRRGGRIRRRARRPRRRSCSRRSPPPPTSRSTSRATILRRAPRWSPRAFPACPSIPVVADFVRPFELPHAVAELPKLGFFPGSTIGNIVPCIAIDLLRSIRDLLGAGALLLIGMDRVKPVERLIAAYDDPQGVTAAVQPEFARTDQPRARRRHSGRGVPPRARWNDIPRGSRCTWSPRATSSSRSRASASAMPAGETIHTENSHKYGQRGARMLLLAGGWTPIAEWSDPGRRFSRNPRPGAPERFAP